MAATGSPTDGFTPDREDERQNVRLLLVLVVIILVGVLAAGIAFSLT